MASKEKIKEMSVFKRDLLGLLFLLGAVFTYLCLFSYHPLDPSLITLTTTPIHNWGGIIGATLADLLFSTFGGGAYFVGLFLVVAASFFFLGKQNKLSLWDVPVVTTLVLLLAVFFDVVFEKLTFRGIPIGAGGLLGGMISRLSLDFLGRPGTYLLVLSGILLTFVWMTHVPLATVVKGVWGVVSFIGSKISQKFFFYKARISKWWERRKTKTETTREEPLIQKIVSPPVAKQAPAEVPLKPVSNFLKQQPQKEISDVVPPIELPKGEPKILERAESKKPKTNPQLEFQNLSKGYQFPPLNLLDSGDHSTVSVDVESLKMNARILETKLLDFQVEGKVTEIHPGPVITMYEFQPAAGIKLSRIANLVDDLSLSMGGRSVRIVAPLPNKPAVGIEVPNNVRETVWLRDIISDDQFQKNETKLPFAIGKDIEGRPLVADLTKMPHLLVAGATGSGKSVSINSMILSFIYKSSPEDVRLIMVDPKMLELSIYEGIPHLLLPVVTEPKKASLALKWAIREMTRRYKLMSDINARNILNYNAKVEKKDFTSKYEEAKKEGRLFEEDPDIKHEGKLPYIVILIDELADLMMVSSKEVEESITRLAQMARASGIHLILATQRPSVDVITGIIKANFPARISFKVSSKHDARTVLDTIGSERLLGAGDMLFIPPGSSRMIRAHGAFITETEVGRIVDFLKKQGKPVYDESILKPIEGSEGTGLPGDMGEEENDELYDQAVRLVAETRQASISMIQRRLRIGFNRAARMIEKMEAQGVVSSPNSSGNRQVLVSSTAEG